MTCGSADAPRILTRGASRRVPHPILQALDCRDRSLYYRAA